MSAKTMKITGWKAVPLILLVVGFGIFRFVSARQALAVDYLIENPVIKIKDYEQLSPGTNRRTLQRDIKALIEKGVLKMEGAARAVCYKLKIKGL